MLTGFRNLLSLALLALAFSPAHADSNTFLPAPGRVDFAPDSPHGKVYITSGGEILRYDVPGQQFLAPFVLGGDLKGLSLSLDGTRLAVADAAGGPTQVWIHILELATGEDSQVMFPRQPGESGTFAVAHGQDGAIYVSSSGAPGGTGVLRRYLPANGTAVDVRALPVNSPLMAGPEGYMVGFAEAGNAAGAAGWLDLYIPPNSRNISTGTLNTGIGMGFGYAAVFGDAGLQVWSSYGAMSENTLPATVSSRPGGAAFQMGDGTLLVPWLGTADVRVYDSSAYQQLGTLALGEVLPDGATGVYQSGHSRLSPDGGLLVVSVPGGARLIRRNATPTVTPRTYTILNEGAFAFTIEATDPDGDPLTYDDGFGLSMGWLDGTAPNLTYHPYNSGSTGVDYYNVYVSDGQGGGGGLITFILQDRPDANDVHQTTYEDTSAVLTLSATDSDSPALTYQVATPPAHGTLIINGDQATYVPAANYHGIDTFTYTATDGTHISEPATVTLEVFGVNDAPVALNGDLYVEEGGIVPMIFPGQDVDGAPPYLPAPDFFVVYPSIGSILNSGIPPYYHAPDNLVNDATTFYAFNVTDGHLTSVVPGVITIHITAVNDTPETLPQDLTTAEDTPLNFVPLASDEESDPLSYQIVAAPAHGVLSGAGPGLTYTPAPNYHGPDSFTYAATDGQATSAPRTIHVTVTPVNDWPVSLDADLYVEEDGSVPLVFPGFDADGDALSLYGSVVAPSVGVVTWVETQPVYHAPYHVMNGDETGYFFYLTDGPSFSMFPGYVTIHLIPVNDAPEPFPYPKTVQEDTPTAYNLAAYDEEYDPLTYQIVAGPAHGTLSGTAPNLTYTPAANHNGPDAFTFTVSDGVVASAPATVIVTVTPANDAPVANAQSLATPEDTARTVTLAGSDIEGSALTFQIVSAPAHGTLSGTAPNLTYTPAANYNGPDAFTFTVSDGAAVSAPATVNVTVTAVNDAPSAQAQSLTVLEDVSGVVTFAGLDPDGSALTFAVATTPANGTLSGTGGARTFTPSANFNGSSSFTYTATDGALTSAPATVSITVTPVNDAPSFNLAGTSLSVNRNTTKTQANWATAISKGPANESTQTVAFTVTNNKTTLFTQQPAISATGTLTFRTGSVKGSATVSVKAVDNGGTANGGANTSVTKTFTITVK